jgi:protein gp37
MGDNSAIEWTEATWNPVTGCDRVSEGCDNCYALALAARLKAMGNPRYQSDGRPRTSGPGFGVTCHDDLLSLPKKWRRPRLVFVNSMSDMFHPDVPESFITECFRTMARESRHTYQILTKRPRRMASLLPKIWATLAAEGFQVPSPNVWLGVSVENQRWADQRIPLLMATPAAVRFLSCEPLLGPIRLLLRQQPRSRVREALSGLRAALRRRSSGGADPRGIDWVIVGGESGPHHRPIDPGWVLHLRDQCVEAGIAFFFKQWGGRTPKAGGRILEGRTWDEMPTLVEV